MAGFQPSISGRFWVSTEGQAIHVLDRFHIMAKMNKVIDEVRAQEAKEYHASKASSAVADIGTSVDHLVTLRRKRLEPPLAL